MRYTNQRTKRKSRDITLLEDGELKGYRLKLDLSRKEMADKLGISHRTLEALEDGRRDVRTTIARLAWLMVQYQEVKSRLDLIFAKKISPEEERRRAERQRAWEEGEI